MAKSSSKAGVSGGGRKRAYTRDSIVKKVSGVEFLTGKRTATVKETGKTFYYESKNLLKFPDDDVCGTDGGEIFYNSKTDTTFILFGDSYAAGKMNAAGEAPDRQWRSNLLAMTKDTDASDGISFDGWFRGNKGKACAIVEGKHLPVPECKEHGYERTKIPMGGIEINGTVYVYYESIRYFLRGGFWKVNYGGVIKSTDNCKTFERVPDLTWFPSVTDQFDYALVSATQSWEDTDKQPEVNKKTIAAAKKKISRADERVAPYFAQCYPLDGKDGYVYIFGRRGGRQHGIKMMRVRYENIEKFDEHEYYLGNDKNGDPIWEKGYEGLAKLNNDEVGYVLASNEDEPASNMSAMWNEYLGKWMLVYYRPKRVDEEGKEIYPASIGFRLSDVPYGNYGEYHTIIDPEFYVKDDHYGFLGFEWSYGEPYVATAVFYGAFVHEKYTEEKGKVFYLIHAIAPPVYNCVLIKIELK